jgi:hypothetical protein
MVPSEDCLNVRMGYGASLPPGEIERAPIAELPIRRQGPKPLPRVPPSPFGSGDGELQPFVAFHQRIERRGRCGPAVSTACARVGPVSGEPCVAREDRRKILASRLARWRADRRGVRPRPKRGMPHSGCAAGRQGPAYRCAGVRHKRSPPAFSYITRMPESTMR